MNRTEVAAMLTYVNTLDGRVGYDVPTVQAWSDVLIGQIESGWAATFVRKHYATSNDCITPSWLNKGWREHESFMQARALVENSEAHCGKVGCRCTHSEPCYKGWLDRDGENVTAPCPKCRQSLWEVLMEIPPLGMRSDADSAMIRNRFRETA